MHYMVKMIDIHMPDMKASERRAAEKWLKSGGRLLLNTKFPRPYHRQLPGRDARKILDEAAAIPGWSKLPDWLKPIQMRPIALSDAIEDYARTLGTAGLNPYPGSRFATTVVDSAYMDMLRSDLSICGLLYLYETVEIDEKDLIGHDEVF